MQNIPNNLKVLYSFAWYKRTVDNTRMTAVRILDIYLLEALKTQFRTAKELI